MPDAIVRFRRTPPPGFAEALAAARQRSGLGLREAARQIGISSGYLGNLEAGRRCPSTTIADRLAEVLELGDDEREVVRAAAVSDAGHDHPARNQAVGA